MYEVLTNDGLKNKLIEYGLKRAKKFTWGKCARETFEVYNKILEARPTP